MRFDLGDQRLDGVRTVRGCRRRKARGEREAWKARPPEPKIEGERQSGDADQRDKRDRAAKRALLRPPRFRLRLRVGGDQAAGDLGARGFRLAGADPPLRLVALKLGKLIAIDTRRVRGGVVGRRRPRQRVTARRESPRPSKARSEPREARRPEIRWLKDLEGVGLATRVPRRNAMHQHVSARHGGRPTPRSAIPRQVGGRPCL